MRNERLRFIRIKNRGRVGALNCDAFGILLPVTSLYLRPSKYISETNHTYQKFRALSRGVVIFFLSLSVWLENGKKDSVTRL